MDAGNYDTLLTWYQRTVTKDTVYGQDEETFADNGDLWGAMEYLSAKEAVARGAEASVTMIRVRFRCFLFDMSTTDRLQIKGYDTSYWIKGVTYGDNETIVEAEANRE
jgi:head-tail adaptor